MVSSRRKKLALADLNSYHVIFAREREEWPLSDESPSCWYLYFGTSTRGKRPRGGKMIICLERRHLRSSILAMPSSEIWHMNSGKHHDVSRGWKKHGGRVLGKKLICILILSDVYFMSITWARCLILGPTVDKCMSLWESRAQCRSTAENIPRAAVVQPWKGKDMTWSIFTQWRLSRCQTSQWREDCHSLRSESRCYIQKLFR